VALDWLDDGNLPLAQPYLRDNVGYNDDDDDDEEDLADFYPPARSVEALREIYISMQARKGSKREVLDRILEGDWRHGLTLYQLAMADLQYLYDHPTSQKWSAYRIAPLKPPIDPDAVAEGDHVPEVDDESLTIPRFHPSTFLRNLQAQVLPDLKAHYNFDAHKTLPLLILRIFIVDSPYNTNHAFQTSRARRPAEATTSFDSSRTVYIAFPNGSPHVFISKPQTNTALANPSTTTASSSSSSSAQPPGGAKAGESASLLTLLVSNLPKALS
jgi:central kinetochore subunit Mis15/CHL4